MCGIFERDAATSTTVPSGIFRRRKARSMPALQTQKTIDGGVVGILKVEAQLDLPSAYELAEEIRAIIKTAIVKGVGDGLREASEHIDLDR